MASLTVDPGLKECAWALVEGEKVLGAGLIRSGSSAKAREAALAMLKAFRDKELVLSVLNRVTQIVVEGQQDYGQKHRARPQDLIDLGLVAGMVSGVLNEWFSDVPMSVPLAREWKGQIDKLIHHRRICKRLGWAYVEKSGKVIPEWPGHLTELRKLPQGMHNHVLDAVAMGLWAESDKGLRFLAA